MARGSFELRGTGDLVRKLKRNANLNDVKNVVKLNGSEMHRSAQRYSPVETGNLKRFVGIFFENGGFTVKVVSQAEYAGYQEYGTRYQPGKPHIRPSYFEQRREFINDMKRLVR